MKMLKLCAVSLFLALPALPGLAQAPSRREALRRFQMGCQIRSDKFNYVLPEAMRENRVDMWIVTLQEQAYDPLYEDLGRGYPAAMLGYYVFTDRGGERIERAALGIDGYMLERCEVYDIVGGGDLAAFVKERDPKRIALNYSDEIGAADGLSHSSFQKISKLLGQPYASRFVSAEKLVSDFRSRRTATEIAAFSEAGQHAVELAERALSNEVIAPGKTTLEEVAWWMQEELLRRGFGSSFDMPSVYITGRNGIEGLSSDRIIQGGDFMTIDWGVCLMNFCTDVKRQAYVLKSGEVAPPAGHLNAFAQAMKVREVIKRTARPSGTAASMLKTVENAIAAAGFSVMKTFNQPHGGETTDVMVGMHSVGNTGHGAGPSMAFFNPKRLTYDLKPGNMISVEFFAYTPIPEWDGAKLRVPIEDDALLTTRGLEFLHPHSTRLLVIK
ncbi:MAG: M24 family metallopeptidase [Vicinamibacteria bacterium]|nr:M24 family metallopeptidase [Vicinamibacteria bacterium]